MADETQVLENDVEVSSDPPAPQPDPGLARLGEIMESLIRRDEERDARTQEAIESAVSKLAAQAPVATPSLKVQPTVKGDWADEYEQRGYTRSDFELARMIMDGAGQLPTRPIEIQPSERFMAAYHANVTEADGSKIWVAADGKPVRAMDTAESGYGADLIGAEYIRELWSAARNNDTLVDSIRTIPMSDTTAEVPIDGDLPEMLFVGESTSASASNYATSKTASSSKTLTTKKFTIQQVWSTELEEDSIIAFTPFLRDRLNMSASLYLGSAYLNGDTTNAGTGNINLDDADPDDTKHYLAWDGIRHYWLVDASGQGKSMAASLDPLEIQRARGKLNGGDDDVDNLIKNINWGRSASDLLLVCDWDTYMAMLEIDAVQTIDKYGPAATLVTGELGRYAGIPIISPSYASKTMADGKASTTEASNTLGQITVFNPSGFLAGERRGVQLFFDRIQRTDQFLIELYTRRAFTRFGGNVASGIYNITV